MFAPIAAGHPEAGMHGGIPGKGHRDHVVVALFDHATGQCIENAEVTASVIALGMGSRKKLLEPMTIADTITYDNYFSMPDNDIYHIKLWQPLDAIVDRTARGAVVE